MTIEEAGSLCIAILFISRCVMSPINKRRQAVLDALSRVQPVVPVPWEKQVPVIASSTRIIGRKGGNTRGPTKMYDPTLRKFDDEVDPEDELNPRWQR